MTQISLKDFYPFLNTDLFITCSDEILEIMITAKRTEASFRRRMYRDKAPFSLDRDDGIENQSLTESTNPFDLYKEKIEPNQLYVTNITLPENKYNVFIHIAYLT